MADVIMPKLGDAMEEGKIVRWLKNVGDSVKSDDPIFEVETDKTNVEVGADISGVLEWIGYAAIQRIEGSYNNVVGLPTYEVYRALKEFYKN